MPGRVDPSQVSSNWRKLQETLGTENKNAVPAVAKSGSHGVKRKRPLERKTSAFSIKKVKLADSGQRTSVPKKKHRMGTSDSRPASTTSASSARTRSRLVKDHDIPADDVSEAYGRTYDNNVTLATSMNGDEINSGLHPTRKAGKYIALDCEMVGTGPPPHADNLLARASLVNFHGEQIYDSYVLPPKDETVEDYRTHVSGIKPQHLLPNVARSFAQVQKDVGTLMEGRILVGHALRNDLQVLLLSHPKRDLRDTSRYPKFRVESKGKPPALRNLVKSELGLRIQVREHSSVEDARATMLLFKKEKVGFEEENRKQFGRSRREGAGIKDTKNRVEDSSIGDEEEGDEENDEEDADGAAATPSSGKRKRKKKKRTKRK